MRESWLHKVAQDFPELRIWLYGYQSRLTDESRTSVTDTWANEFRHSLRRLRPDDRVCLSLRFVDLCLLTLLQKTRPMLILSHSLGGILVKKASVTFQFVLN